MLLFFDNSDTMPEVTYVSKAVGNTQQSTDI